MRQHTLPEQTAKLIELGFEKPKGWCNEGISSRLVMSKHKLDDEGFNYSIGELIEMLPRVIGRIGQDYVTIEISHDTVHWIVGYTDFDDRLTYATSNSELIDAIFGMLIKLKEKELI